MPERRPRRARSRSRSRRPCRAAWRRTSPVKSPKSAALRGGTRRSLLPLAHDGAPMTTRTGLTPAALRRENWSWVGLHQAACRTCRAGLDVDQSTKNRANFEPEGFIGHVLRVRHAIDVHARWRRARQERPKARRGRRAAASARERVDSMGSVLDLGWRFGRRVRPALHRLDAQRLNVAPCVDARAIRWATCRQRSLRSSPAARSQMRRAADLTRPTLRRPTKS